MKILIQIKAVFVSLFLLCFFLVPANLIAAPFKLSRRLKITAPAWQFCSNFLLRYALHTRVRIREDHRAPEFKGVPCSGLYVANHQSYIDIPLLTSCYQAPPIMKKELLYFLPVFGWMAWISGALPVSRSSMASRRKIFERARKRVLVENIGLQVYPEGTRSKKTVPKEFQEIKKTLLVWAFNEKIPVIPTSIYGTRGVLSANGSININKDVGIIVHGALYPKDFPDANSFAKAAWDQVVEGYYRMEREITQMS